MFIYVSHNNRKRQIEKKRDAKKNTGGKKEKENEEVQRATASTTITADRSRINHSMQKSLGVQGRLCRFTPLSHFESGGGLY